MGTGLSIRACVNVQTRTVVTEFEHFCPVPVCFGVIREFMQHSLGVCVVRKDAFSNFSSEGYLDFPLLPFGLSSPVPIRVRSSHLAGLTVRLYKILYLALT